MLIKQICQKSDICHYCYFKNIDFKCEPYLCNGCHDLMQKAISFTNIAIFKNGYCRNEVLFFAWDLGVIFLGIPNFKILRFWEYFFIF